MVKNLGKKQYWGDGTRRSRKRYTDGPLRVITVCKECFPPIRMYSEGHSLQRGLCQLASFTCHPSTSLIDQLEVSMVIVAETMHGFNTRMSHKGWPSLCQQWVPNLPIEKPSLSPQDSNIPQRIRQPFGGWWILLDSFHQGGVDDLSSPFLSNLDTETDIHRYTLCYLLFLTSPFFILFKKDWSRWLPLQLSFLVKRLFHGIVNKLEKTIISPRDRYC